jgi:hypothetical protein
LFLSDRVVIFAKWLGVTDKKVQIQLYCIYNADAAMRYVDKYLQQDLSIGQQLAVVRAAWKERYKAMGFGQKLGAMTGVGEGGKEIKDVRQQSIDLMKSRVNRLHLVTKVNAEKGFFSKLTRGLDVTLVGFNLMPWQVSEAGYTTGRALHSHLHANKTVGAEPGNPWRIVLGKLSPEHSYLGESDIERIFQEVRGQAEIMATRVDPLTDLVTEAYRQPSAPPAPPPPLPRTQA